MAPRDRPTAHTTPLSSSLPGLWKPPSHLQTGAAVTGHSYMEGRRQDDGAEGLWRVHDKLYDLTSFIPKHPGGEHWLRNTKGMDVTELFESHHFSQRAPQLLAGFEVRDAAQRRNSPYTFREDGFFRTLKRRALPVLAATPDPGFSPRFNDALVAAAFLCAAGAAASQSYLAATAAAAFVTWSTVCAHNFTHRKNNWRMYYQSLGFTSLSEWRVSHVFSHHMYPNTLLDIEISAHEPLVQFLPKAGKPLFYRAASVLFFVVYAAIGLPLAFATRMLKPGGVRPEDCLPLLYLGAMLAAGAAPAQALAMWLYLFFAHSYFFNCIALTAAHHHPDIFHDGDAPREDRDWGLGQLDAVRDRADHGGSSALALMFFGDHALHHLFPTVDHCRLPALYPVFNETLAEFGVEYRFSSTAELFVGALRQLTRNAPNPRPPTGVIALGRKLRTE